MKDTCSNCEEKQACIPFFAHENALMHYNATNRRMLTALICVCLTFIITIVVFVCGYTVREQNWLNTLETMYNTPAAQTGVQAAAPETSSGLPVPTEAPHGVYE